MVSDMRFCDNSFVSESGSPVKTTYAPKVLENGRIELVPSGKVNIHDMIQAERASTDISYIIAKLNSGDMSVLRTDGAYGDFTNMPANYQELLQRQIDVNRLFDSLPTDVKIKFDNDRNQFLATAGSDAWYDKLGDIVDRPVITPIDNPVIDPINPVFDEVKE